MLITKEVEVVLNSNNIKYYDDLGYSIPRTRRNNRVSKDKLTVPRGTTLLVKINDLPKGSNVNIEVVCDYCGAVFNRQYNAYNRLKNTSYTSKDCCNECVSLKVKETMVNKYGVEWNTQLSEVKDLIYSQLKIKDEIVRQDFEDKGYILIGEYINILEEIKYICIKHKDKGIQTTIYNNLKNANHVCKYCICESLSGENSYRWKGGISDLNNYLRGKIKSWQIDSYNINDFTCFVTGIKNKKKIVVHHIKPFAEIVKEVLIELDLDIRNNISLYSDDELNAITILCLNTHYKYGLGTTLIDDIHKLFHKKYKSINNTIDQLNEFSKRYKNFEFDDLLEDKYKYCSVVKGVN